MRSLGLARLDLKHGNGPLPDKLLMHAIELYGGEVIPGSESC